MSARLDVNPKQFRDCVRALDMLPRAALAAGAATTRKMARTYQTSVQRGYAAGTGVPLAPGTREKRAQGKRGGAAPAIPKFPGSKPLNRSGTLSSLVELQTRVRGRIVDNVVRIQPGVPLPHGGVSHLVARVHEVGRIVTFTASPRVRTFLRALALGVAGTDTLVQAVSMDPISITVRIPARPIWIPTFKNMLSRQPTEFARIFTSELQKRTKLKVVFRPG